MPEIVVLVTTASEEEASKIARPLIERQLVACANIVGEIRSIFRWEGKIVEEREALMILKSHSDRFEELSSEIKKLHSYSVPEIVALPITQGLSEYLQWVRETTGTDKA